MSKPPSKDFIPYRCVILSMTIKLNNAAINCVIQAKKAQQLTPEPREDLEKEAVYKEKVMVGKLDFACALRTLNIAIGTYTTPQQRVQIWRELLRKDIKELQEMLCKKIKKEEVDLKEMEPDEPPSHVEPRSHVAKIKRKTPTTALITSR